jgi:hypothetical protein
MDNCVVEDGGGADLYFSDRANIAVNENGRLVISNSTVRRSAGWGIFKANSTSILTATNMTYDQNALGNVNP